MDLTQLPKCDECGNDLPLSGYRVLENETKTRRLKLCPGPCFDKVVEKLRRGGRTVIE